MKDAYSFDADEEGLDLSYQAMVQAYKNIYERCGLSTIIVEADSGAIGGKYSHEFMALADSGEDTIFVCEGCGYAANAEKAAFVKPPQADEPPEPIEEVSTPAYQDDRGAGRLSRSPNEQDAQGRVLRGRRRGGLRHRPAGTWRVNEIKLARALDATDLRLATPQEVEAAGLVAGSASPVGLSGVKTIAERFRAPGLQLRGGRQQARFSPAKR